ncbi:hypothetical protein E4U40_005414, partial [Claviceps sp. LM458 group G5]
MAATLRFPDSPWSLVWTNLDRIANNCILRFVRAEATIIRVTDEERQQSTAKSTTHIK